MSIARSISASLREINILRTYLYPALIAGIAIAIAVVGAVLIGRDDGIDGRRLMFSEGWLASRFSGTEPLLRIYCEASSQDMVTKLLDAAQEYLGV